jgi:L-cysteine/cystine lyase
MSKSDNNFHIEFPAVGQKVYLNTGSVGPLSKRVFQAMQEVEERQLQEGRSDLRVYKEEFFPAREELRERFANLIGANSGEIALTHHTTEGMNIAVWGVNWRPGDEIVTTTLEHEAGLLPVYAAARRFGLSIKVVDLGLGEGAVVDKIAAAISGRTRLVVISHVAYTTGAVLPLAEVVSVAHKMGALVAVDGAQSAGAIPVNVRDLGVDFYAMPGQKWLCGPEGMGALYLRHDRLDEIAPTFVGFFAMRDSDAMDLSGHFIPAPSAQRYETSTIYWPAVYGMREALRWFQDDLGLDWIFTSIDEITRHCREMLAAVPGGTVHSPENIAGLTTFSLDGREAEPIVYALAEKGVIIRRMREPTWMRVSTSFFNSRADLELLCEGLSAVGD